MIRATCPACQVSHNYAPNLAGYSVVCSKCGNLLDLPHPSAVETESANERAPQRATSYTAAVGKPPPPRSEGTRPLLRPSDVRSHAEFADRRARLTAWFVDLIATILAVIPTYWLANFLNDRGEFGHKSDPSHPDVIMTYLAVVLSGALAFIAWNAYLIIVRGQSVGKILLGIRIVRNEDSGPAGFFRGFLIRDFLSFCLVIVPGYAILDRIWILGHDKRCLHDLIAGTKVIQL